MTTRSTGVQDGHDGATYRAIILPYNLSVHKCDQALIHTSLV